MLKHLIICTTLLFVYNTHAAEVAPTTKIETSASIKNILRFSYEPELLMFHELIKQHRDETVACFGEPKEGELYYGAHVESPTIRSEGLYFYVPLSVIAKKKESETITIGEYEFIVATKSGYQLESLIEGLKKRFADKKAPIGRFDPSTQQDLTEEQLEKMSKGDTEGDSAAMRRIILRLAQVERETGSPCVIL